MIRTFLTTTALAALLATGAIAQDQPAEGTEAPATEAPAEPAPAEEAPADQAPADQAPADEAPATDAGSTTTESTDTQVVEDVEVVTEGDGDAGALLAQGYTVVDTDNLASRIMGAPVYSSATVDAEHIGDVNDLVVDENGDVAAVVIGVGGFLGIGEKQVAVDYGALEWTVAEDNTERFVLETTREALEAAPDFEWREDDPAARGDAAPAVGLPATDPAAPGADAMAPADDAMAPDGAMAPAGDAMATDGGMDISAMQPIDPASITAEELQGTNVYGPGDEHLGTIGDFVLGENDTIDAVIIDFGGFLGIGVKRVAVGYENLQFYADENDNRILVLNLTREQLEQAPEYNPDTYDAERDTQRLVVQ